MILHEPFLSILHYLYTHKDLHNWKIYQHIIYRMENKTIPNRLAALRNVMARKGLDAVIIPQADPHQSEYIADHWQARRYLSGFTGSAGTLVVTLEEAALWTDSRYFLQATTQLEGTGIQLMKDMLPDTPSISNWLVEVLPVGSKLGIDGWLFSDLQVEDLKTTLQGIATVDTNVDILDEVWPDRPELPLDKAFVLPEEYSGESARSKIDRILMALPQIESCAIWISALDEIAWVLNLRGTDVPCNPVNTAYLYLSPQTKVLFIDKRKVTAEVEKYVTSSGVIFMDYNEVCKFIKSLPKSQCVVVDEQTTSYGLMEALGENRCVVGRSPVPMFKAIKNSTEVVGYRNALRRDGVALVYGFMEIEQRLAQGVKTTEIDVAEIMARHRAEQPLSKGISFFTIAGYGSNGAIIHYSATPETDTELKPEGLLLVDSGGQYLDGTTDITRTVALGTPTPEEKRDFTLVLKGMMALAMAVFPDKTRGIQLDILAHQYLWRAGQNYLHGTGHGVGHFLNVHEGPFAIRNNGRNWELPLEAGIVTSDEPGLYKEGVRGVRCENMLLCIPMDIPGQDGFRYLGFETLTLYPFDLTLVDTSIMNRDEIEWLNAYHRRVYDELSPLLDEQARAWLAERTVAIKE